MARKKRTRKTPPRASKRPRARRVAAAGARPTRATKKRLPAARPATRSEPERPSRTEQLAEAEARLAGWIREGFRGPKEIAQAFDDVRDDWPDVSRAEAKRLTARLFAEQRAREARWPRTTDNDRLDAAFRALEEEGIIVRQDFTCCMTCGLYEIGAELADAGDVDGYAFFHMQDTECAVEGGGLLLAYGSVDGSPESGVKIGHRVVAALQRQKLTVRWNGRFDRRIAVALTWRRRVPS